MWRDSSSPAAIRLCAVLLRASVPMSIAAFLVAIVGGASSAGIILLIIRVWNQQSFTDPLYLGAFVVLLAVVVATGFSAQVLTTELSLRALTDLRLETGLRVMATPLRRLERLGSARLLASLVDDVNTLARVLPLLPRMVIDSSTLVLGTGYLVLLSPRTALALFVLIALGVLLYRSMYVRALHWMKAARAAFDAVFEDLRALTDGIMQLKMSRPRRRSFVDEDLHPGLRDQQHLLMRGRTFFIAAESSTRLLFFALIGVLIFAIPRLEGVDRAILSSYTFMALYLYRPFGSLMNALPELSRAEVALDKIESLDLAAGAEAEGPRPEDRDPAWGSIELDGVSFRYRHERDDSTFWLGPIDLTLRPGEIVFLVGGNGSGKTTLAKVLTSLYAPESGELRLDGEAVTEENREAYRQLFSVIFADFHLFERLPAEGRDVDRRAAHYLERLELEHKVRVENERLSTTELSRGQRKRLALLAAYLEDRPIYVFDEWAADQDPEFKQVFYEELLPELRSRGKTVLVVTHDDRYLGVADRCLVLEEGRLRPSGAPADPVMPQGTDGR